MSAREPQSLHRKLFLARKATEAVEKRGHNEADGYNFARFEDVIAEASKQLEKRDILIVSSMVEEQLHLGRNRTEVLAKSVISFTVIDTKTDESLSIRWAGTGYDVPGDKALFKATTGCEKYFLRSLLNIPFGSDPEAESGSAEGLQTTTPATPDSAQQVRDAQDALAETPHESIPARAKPLPESDVPEPDWTGLEKPETASV